MADIELLEGVGNYVRVYFGQYSPLLHKSLQQLEDKLPADLFFASIASRS
ncbi:MAG: LytTR family transcriptional regulator [Hymenobacteraceae bacterium]|nr:LytTR family transcriptional regulator [Hymenobacteraceae bacterium]